MSDPYECPHGIDADDAQARGMVCAKCHEAAVKAGNDAFLAGDKLHHVVATHLHDLKEVARQLSRAIDSQHGMGLPRWLHSASSTAHVSWIDIDRAHREYVEWRRPHE